jgi:2,5-dioxopentanoate dehydrogenase
MTPPPAATLSAVDPRTGATLADYPETPVGDVARLVAAAVDAAADPALADPELRVEALRGAARGLREAGDELRATCEAESGLPAGRVAGEIERTRV